MATRTDIEAHLASGLPRERLVVVPECAEPMHPHGEHAHVVFVERCPHDKPTRFSCHACDFG